MADKSAIEWTDATWNPIVGCSIKSPGCANCYAMPMAKRIEAMFSDTPGAPQYRGLTKTVNGNVVFTGKVALAPDHILTQPLRWKRGRKIFVNSMGDLFHENVPDEWIDKVFAVMALCPQHTFQMLTKRAERMREYLMKPVQCTSWTIERSDVIEAGMQLLGCEQVKDYAHDFIWPLPNLWLGVSTERQQEADERIPYLLQTPAAVRFISAEPLLGPISIWHMGPNGEELGAGLDWVIVGGESGRGARPMHAEWARSLRDQCAAADAPFFFKQWGEWYDEATISAPEIRGTQYESDRLIRVGKKAAGRLLDGKEHNEFPKPVSP